MSSHKEMWSFFPSTVHVSRSFFGIFCEWERVYPLLLLVFCFRRSPLVEFHTRQSIGGEQDLVLLFSLLFKGLRYVLLILSDFFFFVWLFSIWYVCACTFSPFFPFFGCSSEMMIMTLEGSQRHVRPPLPKFTDAWRAPFHRVAVH